MRRLSLAYVVVFATALACLFLSPATPAEAVDAAPSVTSILPNNGPSNSRTHITITGTGFSSTPTVVIGGTAATNVQRINATTLTAITVASTAGAKDVVVTNPDGQIGTGISLFTYNAAIVTGGTWSSVPRFVNGAKAVAISQANNAATPIITVVASNVPAQTGLIHRSLDRGLTWTTLAGPIAPDGQGDGQHSGWWAHLVASADGQKLFLMEQVTHQCCPVGSIWVSSDGGTNWSRANAGFANNRLLYSDIAMSADGTKLWATVQNGSRDGGIGIYYSADGGTTWSRLPNTRFPGATQDNQRYDAVSVSSDGQKVAVSAWDNSRWYSLNGGTTFTAWAGRAFQVSVDGEYAYGRPDFSATPFPTATNNVFTCGDFDCPPALATTRIATASGGKILATPEFGGVARARFSHNGGFSWVTTSLTTETTGCSSGQAAGRVALSSDGTLGAITHPGCGLVLGVFEGLPPPTMIDIASITGEFGTALNGERGGWNGGGRLVEVTGKNFIAGARVSFGRSHNNPNQAIAFGTNAVVINSNTLRVTTPAVDYSGFVSVYVTNPDGQTATWGFGRSISEIGLCNPQAGVRYCFQYQDAGMRPGALVLTPSSGSPAGGTVVDVAITAGGMEGGDNGTAFDWNQGITFDGTPGTNGAQRCGTPCGWRITTPAHAEGPVDVAVLFGVQGETIRKTTVGAFTYASLGAITEVNPGRGGSAGGLQVQIRGAGFANGATVRFGTVLATNVNVLNSTTLTATAPANEAGTVNISVANVAGNWGVGSNLFTYVAAPTVTSVTPSSGVAIGGTAVTIAGTGFSAGASVTFGGMPATTVVVVNPTTITAVTPARAAGLVNVVVTNTDASGSGTGTGVFTYNAGPTVTSLNVISGPRVGGNTVIITGTNFGANPSVRVGRNAATNILRLSATRISIRMPAGAVGLTPIFVTNADNQSARAVASGGLYRYYDLNTRANRQKDTTLTILAPLEVVHSNTAPTTVQTTTASRNRTGEETQSSSVTVTVPVGAIPSAERIVVEPIASLTEMDNIAPKTGATLAAVSAQALDTDGNEVTTNFNAAVSIVISVPANSVPTGSTAANMKMQYWTGTVWQTISSTTVLQADGSMTITAAASHFTLFSATYVADVADVAGSAAVPPAEVSEPEYTIMLDGGRSVQATAPYKAAINLSGSTVLSGRVATTNASGNEDFGTVARITVPAGAVPGGTSVVLQSPRAVRNLVASIPVPGGQSFSAVSVQMLNSAGRAITTNFTEPITVALTVPVAAVSGIATADLQLRYWSGTEWVVVPSKVQANTDGSVAVSAYVLHSAVFAVTVPTASPTTGMFLGAIPRSGVALALWGGGSASLAKDAAAREGCDLSSLSVPKLGTLYTYIPGAPSFVNAEFIELLGASIPARAAAILVCSGNTPAPTALR